MNHNPCDGCFLDQRSINDILAQTIIDAQAYANKENVQVAVIQEGRSFTFIRITGQLPAATRKVVEPGN